MKIEDTIRWTGDNREEMIQFYPYILDLWYEYKDWPGIQAIGAQNLTSGSIVEIPMRGRLMKDNNFGSIWLMLPKKAELQDGPKETVSYIPLMMI